MFQVFLKEIFQNTRVCLYWWILSHGVVTYIWSCPHFRNKIQLLFGSFFYSV